MSDTTKMLGQPEGNCPNCRAPIPAGAPDGLCPTCILGGFLDQESTELGGAWDDANSPLPGEAIGRYKLLQVIGEGGFGVVYMAEQTEPVKRRVALKVIKPGMDSREVIARFEAERQALAMMDHPNIARVFDGGSTESGRPYFVMELVRGLPITEFCDARRMPPPERLELFRKVCLAVQHAHQKGIIHRDLKPSNILVTVQDDQPMPKVIDFGVAKALQAQLTERTLFTRFNQWLGTPAYMSPEQAGLGGLDVDTRSDVYSLGAVLYELLTGHRPFDDQKLREKGYEAMLQAIREEDAPKASTRLTSLPHGELQSVAQHRGGTPEKLAHTIKGELDWILLKALERDRTRRYESASALAHDLLRYSTGEPISAAPPTFSCQVKRLARRHWKAVSIVAAFSLLLVSATVVSVWQMITATEARDAAIDAGHRADEESSRRRGQLQEAARSDRSAALEMLESGSERDAFAFLARACDYDPQSSLAAEAAVYYLNTISFAREVRVLIGEGEFPIEPMGRSGWIERRQAGQWAGASDAAFSPDDRYILSNAHLWEAQSGRLLETISAPPAPEGVGAIDWPGKVMTQAGTFSFDWPWDKPSETGGYWASPDGVASVTTRDGKAILEYRGSRGGSRTELPGDDPTEPWARFSSDSLRLAAIDDARVNLYDVQTGTVASLCVGHAYADLYRARFNRDGDKLVTTSEDTTIRIWETAGRRLRDQAADIGMDQGEFSPDSRLVATHGSDSKVRVRDVENGRQVSVAALEVPEVELMLFSPDGTLLHLSGPDGLSVLVETNSGNLKIALEQADPDSVSLVRSAAFSPDGTWFATGGQDAAVRVWDCGSGRLVATLADHPQTVTSMEFSPDGTMLATACWRERVVQVWDTTTWRRLSRMFDLDVRESVVWSPDSRLLTAASDRAKALYVWHARSGELVARPPLGGADLRDLSYAADGKSIVTASHQGGPYIWEAPGFTGSVPPWFADFLRCLVQRKVDTNGRARSLSPGEVAALLREVEAGAMADGTRYGEIARWFLAPAAQRPVRPGMTLTRHELADRLVTPTASPDQLMRALDYDPANVLAHLALARFVGTKEPSASLRRWARERFPSPIPAEFQQRVEAIESATFQPEPLVALPDGFTIPESTISPDGRYGVSILVAAGEDGSESFPPRRNELVQLEPLRVLATIDAGYETTAPGRDRITSRWTKDSSGLLWIDERESFPRAPVFLHLQNQKVLWQRNLHHASMTEIRDRVLEGFPASGAAAGIKASSALPPGFRVEIELPPADDEPSLPLQFAVLFDSNPMGPDSARFPLEGEIVGRMAGVLDQDGKLIWSEFDVATGQSARERRTTQSRKE